jgi:excisionase family DNA binding protein
MTKATQNDERLVLDVPEAGRKLGLSRNAAYEAAARGEIPTIKIGKLLKVPKVAFDRMLEQAGLIKTGSVA